jgi:hypothetical protein
VLFLVNHQKTVLVKKCFDMVMIATSGKKVFFDMVMIATSGKKISFLTWS